MKRILTGNDAVALGALHAGVRVVTGYPGTPSTEALASLLARDLPGRHVEWSTNEKVAFEIAAGAAWAGRRALATMKMSGLNVAYDAVISIAYSGTNAGLVVYVADDPGVSAGMPEQDTRGFALMSDTPMLEPSSVEEAYRLTQTAFELSEAIGGLVFLRLTTAVALTHSIVDAPGEAPVGAAGVDESGDARAGDVRFRVGPSGVILERNVARYTKAGAAICLSQHQALLARLEAAGRFLHERGLHRLDLGKKGGLGIAVVGAPAAYIDEALSAAGLMRDEVSILRAASTIPFPTEEVGELFAHCESILVLEELEAHFERQLLIDARRVGFAGRIIGKLDGTLSRSGEYGLDEIASGLAACGLWPVEGQHVARGTWPVGNHDSRQATSHQPQAGVPPCPQAASYKPQAEPAPRPITVCAGVGARTAGSHLTGEPSATVLPSADLAAPRPITVCAGCPHRGTYMAIEAAVKQAGFKKDEVMVTGDIGCTILGMNPPFDLLWNEVSMGSSVSLAQGYVHAGIKTPVIATIGDSTFFHGGIPGVLNAVQHRVPLVIVVMDNGWTGMTGMQVNPGTAEAEQKGGRRIDLAQLIPALGVDRFAIADPYDLAGTTAVLTEFLQESAGVRVLLARRECAIQSRRRGVTAGKIWLDAAKCVLCKQCIKVTGCPALSLRQVAETELGENGDSPQGESVGRKRPEAASSGIVGDFSQAAAIVVDAAACNGCGLCAAVCPTGAFGHPPAHGCESSGGRPTSACSAEGAL
jgi:indolepyruvate ferredoxin oxidoreductase alpha subunit